MFKCISKGLVLSLSVSTVAVGCAGTPEENVASDEGAATAATTRSALAHDYEGTIGNQKVFVRIHAQGSVISGNYFYADKDGSDDQLILKGAVQGSTLTMTESVNGAGSTTGTFNGTVAADAITGTWKAGNTTLPLRLTAIKSLKTAQHRIRATAADCSLQADVVEIFGLDEKPEKAMMDALTVAPLAKDHHCAGDLRIVSQRAFVVNHGGFLTVHVASENDGGAHPENSSDYYNFNVATGANIGTNDIFATGSEAKVKDLIEKGIMAHVGEDQFTDEDAKRQIEEFEQHWGEDAKLDTIVVGVIDKGLVIDLRNNYPHVILELAPVVTVPWSDVKPLLKAGSAIAAIVN